MSLVGRVLRKNTHRLASLRRQLRSLAACHPRALNSTRQSTRVSG